MSRNSTTDSDKVSSAKRRTSLQSADKTILPRRTTRKSINPNSQRINVLSELHFLNMSSASGLPILKSSSPEVEYLIQRALSGEEDPEMRSRFLAKISAFRAPD